MTQLCATALPVQAIVSRKEVLPFEVECPEITEGTMVLSPMSNDKMGYVSFSKLDDSGEFGGITTRFYLESLPHQSPFPSLDLSNRCSNLSCVLRP